MNPQTIAALLDKYPFASKNDFEHLTNCMKKMESFDRYFLPILERHGDTRDQIVESFDFLFHVMGLDDSSVEEDDYQKLLENIKKDAYLFVEPVRHMKDRAPTCKKFVYKQKNVDHKDSDDELPDFVNMCAVCSTCNMFQEFHMACDSYAKEFGETCTDCGLKNEYDQGKDYVSKCRNCGGCETYSLCETCGLSEYDHNVCDKFHFVRNNEEEVNYTNYVNRIDNVCLDCGKSRLDHQKGHNACSDFQSDGFGGCLNCIFSDTNHISDYRSQTKAPLEVSVMKHIDEITEKKDNIISEVCKNLKLVKKHYNDKEIIDLAINDVFLNEKIKMYNLLEEELKKAKESQDYIAFNSFQTLFFPELITL